MKTELQIKTKLSTDSRFDKKSVDGLPRIGQWAVENIRKNIIEQKITASGRTQASAFYRIDGEKSMVIGLQAGDRAPATTLQWGRPAGKVPKNFTDILKQWILDKRITFGSIAYKRNPSRNWKPKYTPQERGLNALAGAIAYNIRTKGTKRHSQPNENVYSPVINEVIDLFKQYIIAQNEKMIVETLTQKIK